VRERGLHEVQERANVRAEVAVELLGREILQLRDDPLVRRVVDEDVDLPELVHAAAQQLLTMPLVGDVAAHEERAPSRLLDDVLRLVGVTVVGDEDVRPLARERERDRAFHPAVRAGDQRDFSP
jgi:hypothetical protein